MENEMEKTISLGDLFALVLSHIKAIILISIVVALAAFGVTKAMAKPTYTYTSSMMIYTSIAGQDTNEMTITQAGQAYMVATYYTNTYRELLKSGSFCTLVREEAITALVDEQGITDAAEREAALDKHRAALSPNSVKNMVYIGTEEDLLMFTISVSSKNQTYAKAVAQAIMQNAPSFTEQYYESCELKVVDAPTGSQSVRSPYTMAAIGFIAAFLVSAFLCCIVSTLDRKVRDEAELASRFGIPVLGVIPDFDSVKKVK